MSIAPVGQAFLIPSREEEQEFLELLWDATWGDAEAQYQVGMSYLDGLDGIRDESKGVSWLEVSAQQECPAAQRELALLLQKGEWVAEDKVRAFDLLCYAAGAGDSLARYHRAIALLEGCGVVQDIALGMLEMGQMAEEGLPEARAYLNQRPLAPARVG